MTLIRGLWCAALLDFPSKPAVKSTEVAVSSFAVESDYSSTAESAGESRFGGAVAGDEVKQMAVADGSAQV